MRTRKKLLAAILAALLALGGAACTADTTTPDGAGAESDPADLLPTDAGTG